MDTEQGLRQVADKYAQQGYQVILRPGPGELPPFAKGFQVDILARRGAMNSVIQVKRSLQEVSADANMSRLAEITNAQPGWRFDFVILEAENPTQREIRGAKELSDEDINQALIDAEQLVHAGFLRPAMLSAWAALEATMRRRLRAAGEAAGWGTLPRPMLSELYSAGTISASEFPQLERMYQMRNQIVHGFASSTIDAGDVKLLTDTARRLLEESRLAKQTA
jgi:hypothetical protein